jgi:hypothetical protein
MSQDAGKLFKGLIREYDRKANKIERELRGRPKPPGLGAFWLNSETGVLHIAALNELGEPVWRPMSDGDEDSQMWV